MVNDSRSTHVAIFDFDGTLADVAVLLRKMYSEEAVRRGWPELTDDAYTNLRKGTIRQALKWAGIRSWQLPALLRGGRKRFYAASESVQLFPGIATLLKKLHADGWEIYVLSSNSPKTIREVLRRNDVDHVHVLNRPTLFGKARTINQLVDSKRYDRQNVWMIGDEVRDIEAGHRAGVRTLAVAWGLQDESILKLIKPHGMAREVRDIERIFKAKPEN